jgi:RHS repeat-associated protein
MVISSAGVVEDEADYSAFGTEYPVTSSGGNHYKFSGKERDTESGLDYFGARYYSNAFGRFLTPDWAAKATAVPYANFGDPQTLNLYGYVRNVPTSLVDGDGHGFVNEAFQDWGFDLLLPGWGTQNGVDAANLARAETIYISSAAGMATEQGTPHTYESSPPNPGFLDKLQAFFSADGIPDSRQYKLSLIRSMLDDLLGVKEVPNPAAGDTLGDPPPKIPVPLKIIHLVPPLQGSASYQEWNKKSTQEIIESLDPKKDDGLKVYPDGAIANGNSRITVLKERGVDVDRLPRDVINKAPVPDPIEPK